MSWLLYVLMMIFLSKTSAKTPDKHEFKRSAKQFDDETYNLNFSLFKFFLNYIIYKNYTEGFRQKHYTLVKAS